MNNLPMERKEIQEALLTLSNLMNQESSRHMVMGFGAGKGDKVSPEDSYFQVTIERISVDEIKQRADSVDNKYKGKVVTVDPSTGNRSEVPIDEFVEGISLKPKKKPKKEGTWEL